MRITGLKKIIAGICVCIMCLTGIYILSRYQNPSLQRPIDQYPAEQLHSMHDCDQDGIDDQTDILQSALEYISAKPKYQSKYYGTGYPDDEYGVCTDVVAYALQNTGYDLMILVQRDIEKYPEEYDIDIPDKNIDFRRVKNLKVFFSHTAESLTTDIFEIMQWQGGDIVIFADHIGIISDRRNKKGIPYVIHHNGPWQLSYEEDILADRNDIFGHYRIGSYE